MTQEDKELLLKDVCARLPYKVRGNYLNEDGTPSNDELLKRVVINYHDLITCDGKDGMVLKGEIKPYLFPLSSMTNKMWDKEFIGYGITEFTRDSFKYGCETLEFYDSNPCLSDTTKFINKLIKNHFDIHGIIPKGLALDATSKNIY